MFVKRKNYDLENAAYEYIGHASCVIDIHKNIIAIRNVVTNVFYLNIYGKNIDIKYLIIINIGDATNTLTRYNKQQIMDDARIKNMMSSSRVWNNEYQKMFKIPKTTNDEHNGWHSIHKVIKKYDNINDVKYIENLLISDRNTYNMFIKQMTSFDSADDATVIETLYSASLLVYIYDYKTLLLHEYIYFNGDDINDIPVDVYYHMDKYNDIFVF
jgi:hypothetical protein